MYEFESIRVTNTSQLKPGNKYDIFKRRLNTRYGKRLLEINEGPVSTNDVNKHRTDNIINRTDDAVGSELPESDIPDIMNARTDKPYYDVKGPGLQETTEGFGLPNTELQAPEFEVTTDSFTSTVPEEIEVSPLVISRAGCVEECSFEPLSKESLLDTIKYYKVLNVFLVLVVYILIIVLVFS